MSAGVFYIFSCLTVVSAHLRPQLDFTEPSSGTFEPMDADWTMMSGYDLLVPQYLHTYVGPRPPANNDIIGKEDKNAKLRFYYNSINNFTELPLSEAHKILSHSWYDHNKSTVIFCHGFTGHPQGPAVTSVVSFFLKLGKFNVALLNWDQLAGQEYPSFVNSYLNWATPNAKKVGAEFGNTLISLSAGGVDLNKTHLVGHSLGAHVLGVAGNTAMEKGVQLAWITGLDPASVGFDGKPPASRLNPDSARFVSVIHTDPNKYGSKRELGFVDFWPNYRNRGQVQQTGCSKGSHPRFSQEDLCDHNRCWQLLIDAYQYPGTLIGSHAKNFRVWKNYSEDERNADVLEIGTFNPNAKPGNYYLVTTGTSPYGLGKNGLG